MKKMLLILLLLFITGCTDYRELTDMAIVSNIAIDYNDKYRVIIQVLNNKNNNDNVVIYDGHGNTIEEALRNISLNCPKKLYLGHIRTFIVNNNVNISKFIDFVLRNHEIEKDFNILITEDNIEDIMNIKTKLINIPSENISNSIKNSSIVKGTTNNMYFDKFLMVLYDIGIDPVLPVINIKDNKLVLDNKLAVFKSDKLVDYLDEDEALGYNLLNKSALNSIITFKCDNNNYSSIEILDIDSNYKFENNTLLINLKLTATLKELNCNIDITNNKGIDVLKNMFINETNKILNKTINKEKDLLVDYIGIGKYLYENNYKYYINSNINDLIKNMNSKIDIDVIFTQKSSIKKGDEKY